MEKTSLTLDTPISDLPRLTPRTARDFAKLGIITARDLLFHIPFRYEDFSRTIAIGEMKIGERATLHCQVLIVANRRSPRKQRLFTEALFRDETGTMKAVWFNQPYLPKLLRRGDWIFLVGTLEKSYFGIHLSNPIFERSESGKETVHTGRLVPIYPSSGDLSNRQIRNLVTTVMPMTRELSDWLPSSIRERHSLPTLPEAVQQAHFPHDLDQAARAKQRLAFDELFLTQLAAVEAHHELDLAAAPAIPFDEQATKTCVQTLPFTLTNDQRRAAWEIIQDLGRGRPMNRLLEGDVGSGKTVVAAIAALNVTLAGFQTLYLAPTEILAEQQAQTLGTLLKGFPIHRGLLTAGRQELNGEPIARSALEAAVHRGEVSILVGTHALLEDRVRLPNIGLVIIDEQHRFGVEQRKRLRTHSERHELIPHLLSMTATPIPRTMALTIYGDLDLSIIRQLPKARKPITTQVIPDGGRLKAYALIRRELAAGRQAFVICPLISESDHFGVRSAIREAEALKTVFPEFTIGLLHGKLSSGEKRVAMEQFKNGATNLLVATAVVEVGIDVPNATIMLIEGAERFGLAQLHQFRGRIGRGGAESYCFLFTDQEIAEVSDRLSVFAKTSDGFALAEHDLALRGPGELSGTMQSGLPKFRFADFQNLLLLELARREAEILLNADPELENHPLIRERFLVQKKAIHLE